MTGPGAPRPPAAALADLPATEDERRASGRAARKRVSRAMLGYWAEDDRGHDALETILAQSRLRVPGLVPLRHQRMAVSAWNYYRGAAAVMAADLASQPSSGLMVQLCGDAHILNFGLWATPERNLSFDLRDFDETLPGPFEWDVKRFAASVVVAARGAGEDAPNENSHTPHRWMTAGLVERPLDPGSFQDRQSQPADWPASGRVHADGEVAAAGDDVPAVLVAHHGRRGAQCDIEQLFGWQSRG